MVEQRSAEAHLQSRERAGATLAQAVESLRREFECALESEVTSTRTALASSATAAEQRALSAAAHLHSEHDVLRRRLDALSAHCAHAQRRTDSLSAVARSHRANVQRYEEARLLSTAVFALRDAVSSHSHSSHSSASSSSVSSSHRPLGRELTALRLAASVFSGDGSAAATPTALQAALDRLPAEVGVNGVCTRAEVEMNFAQLLAGARRASLLPADTAQPSLLQQLMATVLSRVLLPVRGLVSGTHPEARLSRCEYHIGRGHLHLAVLEAEQLSGHAGTVLADWLCATRHLLAVEQTLLLAESEARIALDRASPLQ
jgi:Mitochondrial inner membrane protein